jgi:hypothetical protein
MTLLLDRENPSEQMPAPVEPEQGDQENPSEQMPAPVGPEQGVIDEARRRQRLRRMRALAALLILAGAGGLVAASTGGGPGREAPLHLPPEPVPALTPTSASGPGAVIVRLSPNIEGGQAGWCVEVIQRHGGGGTCTPLPTRNHPLLGGTTGWTRGEPDATTVTVTGPRVAYVLVDGVRRVPTVQAGLPFGLRIAVIHTPYVPSADGRRFAMSVPTLKSLSSAGVPIVESTDYGSGLPFRDWNPPSAPAQGACQLHASGLQGLKAEWGQVATAIRPYAGAIVGRGFLSCIDTEYYLPGRGMRAAVLLDAASPGRAAPGEIPGLTPIRQAPGLYNGSRDYSFRGPMTAKREGDAWVVVVGGGRNAEEARIRLLRHLTATISLRRDP